MDIIYQIIGYDNEPLEWWQISIRALIIFVYTIIVIRLSNKRIFGKHSAFDIVLGIVLGSILSRAITGNAPFFATMIAGLLLALLHRLLGFIAAKKKFGSIIKGNKQLIVDKGEFETGTMQNASLSPEDVMESLRLQEGNEDMSRIKSAFLERSGDISFVMKKDN